MCTNCFYLCDFFDVVFLVAKDLAAIDLDYAGGPRSTLVVETNEYMEIMDDDLMEPPL